MRISDWSSDVCSSDLIPWTQARHVIRAVTPTRKEAGLLGVNASAACLELDRTTWRAGRVVTHVRQLFRGDRFDLVAEFNAGPCGRPTGLDPRVDGVQPGEGTLRAAPMETRMSRSTLFQVLGASALLGLIAACRGFPGGGITVAA